MDDRRTYMNKQLVRPDPPSKSGGETDVSYAELHFKTLSDPRVRTDGDRLTSTYSELNLRKSERHIEDEDIPTASRPAELRVIAQTAAQERESKVKIRNRPYCLICLLCLVTFALIVTVAGLSIHVSQIHQSQSTSDQNCHELNSTLQFKLSALNSNLSGLKRTHSDLRHQFTEMETKYRSSNETKAQICELLTSRREQTCSKDWTTNKDRCYYVSTFETRFYTAMQECSNRDARLLQIKSSDEASFVSRNLVLRTHAYWIGKCEDGNVGFSLLYKVSSGKSDCGDCNSFPGRNSCSPDRRFICEKPAPLIPDIPEKIQDLCQQPVEPT